MVGVLLLLDRRFRFKPPALFALYVSLYTFGRFFEELLRIDPSHEFAGLRLNAWVSIVVFVLSTAFFIWWQFFHQPKETARPRPTRVAGGADDGDSARTSLDARDCTRPPSRAGASPVTKS